MSSTDFIFDSDRNEYRCPEGKLLHTTNRVTNENTIIYRSRNSECAACPLKEKCCPNTPMRKIARSIHEEARDVARNISLTAEYRQSRRDRKKVEVLFGHLKNILRFDRLRLRGLSGAQDEFILAATAQNLRRLAKLCYRPPPDDRIGVPV